MDLRISEDGREGLGAGGETAPARGRRMGESADEGVTPRHWY